MSLIDELRVEREHLFERCSRLESPQELLSIEEEVAHSIRKCERIMPKVQYKDALRFHTTRLRLYMDGLVWRVLHPHTIRQLATGTSTPPSIEGQGKAFDQVLKSARAYFKLYPVPIFITDLTNVLRVGDLAVCLDPQVPMIVECKSRLPEPGHLLQGRIGRQVSRAVGTLDYLATGSAKIFGEDYPKQAIESPHIAQRNWDVVTTICQDAQHAGHTYHRISEYEAIWAYTPDQANSVNSEIKQYATGDVFLGTSLGLMNMSDGLFPPPSVWPIARDLRFLVLEEKLILLHLVDIRAFERHWENGGSVAINLLNSFPVSVRVNGTEYSLARRFLYDVLYGFETVGSCVKGMVDFVHQIDAGASTNIPRPATGIKPAIHHIQSEQDAQMIVSLGFDGKTTLVSMPVLLAEQLELHHAASGDKGAASGQRKSRGNAYVVMNLQTLRAILEGKGPAGAITMHQSV